MHNKTIIAATFAAALAAAPAFAQSTTGGTGTTGNNSTGAMSSHPSSTGTAPGAVGSGGAGMAGPGASNRADSGSNKPSDVNPVMTDSGDVRASKVIGSSVYNEKNEKIGAIDDILLGKDNKPAQAVVSVGGFLGIGSKLVAVPYDKLTFGNTKDNSDNRVMMPGATKDTVGAMSDFHYSANG